MNVTNLFERIKVLIKERSIESENLVFNIIERSKTTDTIFKIGDIKLKDEEEMTPFGLKPINTNKTPDILIKKGDNYWIGDITVTRAQWTALSIKTNKYFSDIQLLKQSNPTKRFNDIYIIIHESCNNIINDLKPLLDLFDVPYSVKILINQTKQSIININKKIKELEISAGADFDKLREMLFKDTNKKPSEIGSNKSIPKYTPKLSEEQLADMIFRKMKTDKVDESDMIDEHFNLSSVLNQLKINNDEDFKPRKINSSLPYLINMEESLQTGPIDMLEEYRDDLALNSSNQSFILQMLPVNEHLNIMKKITTDYNETSKNANTKNTDKYKFREELKKKYGQSIQYWSHTKNLTRSGNEHHDLVQEYMNLNEKINAKKEPESIPSSEWTKCFELQEDLNNYLSTKTELNMKSSNINFDIPDYGIDREERNIADIKPVFDKINNSKGFVLASIIRKFVNDLAYMPAISKAGIYYSIPVYKNCIFGVLTNNNIGSKNPHYAFFTITRFKKDKEHSLFRTDSINNLSADINKHYPNLLRTIEETENYFYTITTLQKYTLEKFSKLNNIDSEFRCHAMSMGLMISTLDKEKTESYFSKYIGGMTHLLLDLHQKPSEILDLMKYLVSMPFSARCSVKALLLDKLNIMKKTPLDIWLILKIIGFFHRNVVFNKINKPNKMIITPSGISSMSFNVTGNYAMFFDESFVTSNLVLYLSESQLLFHARPKKLYNSQFLDKACIKVAENNKQMDMEESSDISTWVIDGLPKDNEDFPFDSDYGFSRDALYYAQLDEDNILSKYADSIKTRISGIMKELSLHNLSMRGGCIEQETMAEREKEFNEKINNNKIRNSDDYKQKKKEKLSFGKSITSLKGGLDYMADIIKTDNTDKARVINIALDTLDRKMLFNMSEKEQRGSGRPIGSPSFTTKQKLYLIEHTYKIIDKDQNENLLVKGVNRSAKISSIVTNSIKTAVDKNMKEIFHIVMDQSQFSEGDNLRKFKSNIQDNLLIPQGLKGDLMDIIDSMMERVQFFTRLPDRIKEEDLIKYNFKSNGIIGKAGWVQGMLNLSSTHIHIISVKWLAKLFNLYYSKFKGYDAPEIICEHIVNSDDSYCIVIGHDREQIMDFYDFLIYGKKMFCLRQNKKKSYLSKFLGEIIQKYVAHGSVVNIWAKQAISVFNNNQGIDLTKDISSSIGVLQNLIRDGAPETMCTYLRSELKNQLFRLYNLGKNKSNSLSKLNIDYSLLPCELGGWPSRLPTFDICQAGSPAQSTFCMNYYKLNPDCIEYNVTTAAVMLNNYRISTNDDKTIIYEDGKDNNFKNETEKMKNKLADVLKLSSLDDDIIFIDEENIDELTQYELAVRKLPESNTDSNFSKSMLNPFCFIIPCSKNVSDTIKTLKGFEYTPSGMAGLLKIRSSIKTAVSDLNDILNTMLINLSESGFSKDLRARSKANAAIAGDKSVMLSGYRSRFTLIRAYNALIKVYFSVKKEKIDEYKNIVLVLLNDRTTRSQIAKSISSKAQLTSKHQMGNTIVTKLPNPYDDLETSNDLQLVLSEMAKPGILAQEGYEMKIPSNFESDKITIINLFKDWIDSTEDKVNCYKAIYFHYLNSRRVRWFTGYYIDNTTILTALKTIYSVSRDGAFVEGYQMGSLTNIPLKSRTINDNYNVIIMTIWELLLYCYKNCKINDETANKWETIAKSIEIDHEMYKGNVIDLLNDRTRVMEINNYLHDNDKRYLSALLFLVKGDHKLLIENNKQMDGMTIDWIKEQEITKNLSGKIVYRGEFEVRLCKGNYSIIIDGKPGDINMIKANTNDIHIISKMIFQFLTRVQFEGYNKPKSYKKTFLTGFFKNNKCNMSQFLISTDRFGLNTIVSNSERFKKFLSIVDDFNDEFIPFNYIPSLATNRSIPEAYSEYEYNHSTRCIRAKVEKMHRKYDYINGGSIEELVTESVNIISLKDTLYMVDYKIIKDTGFLNVEGIPVQKLIEKGIMRHITRNEYHKISSSSAIGIIKDIITEEKIFYRSMINLFNTCRDDNIFKTSVTNDIELEEVIIEVSTASTMGILKSMAQNLDDPEIMDFDDNYITDKDEIKIDDVSLIKGMLSIIGRQITSQSIISTIPGMLFNETTSKILKCLKEADDDIKNGDWEYRDDNKDDHIINMMSIIENIITEERFKNVEIPSDSMKEKRRKTMRNLEIDQIIEEMIQTGIMVKAVTVNKTSKYFDHLKKLFDDDNFEDMDIEYIRQNDPIDFTNSTFLDKNLRIATIMDGYSGHVYSIVE
uniref:RNA-directed RNA polymerase L n=1 Tax=Notori virus TaxID=2170595 RepID=A0A2U3TMP5_9VIRU|nr:putative RNA-dependent RNA polymerase [Notori virus]